MADAVQVADKVIEVVADVALSVAETAIIAEVPFLGLPVIKQLWEYFARMLMSKLIEQLQNSSTIMIITGQNDLRAQEAGDAATALRAAQADPTITPEKLQGAKDDFKKKYADLIRERIATPRT